MCGGWFEVQAQKSVSKNGCGSRRRRTLSNLVRDPAPQLGEGADDRAAVRTMDYGIVRDPEAIGEAVTPAAPAIELRRHLKPPSDSMRGQLYHAFALSWIGPIADVAEMSGRFPMMPGIGLIGMPT
jgi:hypothetical protein